MVWHCKDCQINLRNPDKHIQEYPNHQIRRVGIIVTKLSDKWNDEHPDGLHIVYLNNKVNETREERAKRRKEYVREWYRKKICLEIIK